MHDSINQAGARTSAGESELTDAKTFEQLTEAVEQAIDDKKAIDPLIIDVRGRCIVADRFIIASGRSDRHLKAMAEAVSEVAHRFGLPVHVEGLDAMVWLLIDLGDIVVHLFMPDVRKTFQLENLWSAPEAGDVAE